jgi:hypothetical protein
MLFQERQLFIRHWWPLLLVPAVMVTVLLLVVPPKPGPAAFTWLKAVGPLLGLAGVVLLLALRLETRLDRAGAHYRLFPLQWQWRVRPWSEVSRAYVRAYDPLGEYGGWGLKGKSSNRALNISGSQGLQLELQTGHRLLLGTQRPAEVMQVLQHFGVPDQDVAAAG